MGSVSTTQAVIPVAAPGTTFLTPADGRLRGQDFVATVTGVAWPDRASVNGHDVDATTGHRFAAFDLTLTEDAQALAPNGSDPGVTAALVYGSNSSSLSLASINDQISNREALSTWVSGSGSFVVSVPNTVHTVDLVLRQGSFSQSFDLWSLRRDPPSPSVLYRSTNRPTLTSSSGASTELSMTNPSDGFSNSAEVSLQSATLSYFAAPDAATGTIAPDQALLSVILAGSYPNDTVDPGNSGTYLGSDSPLPASFLTFTPTGGSAVTSTMSESGYSAGEDNDDGLFDAIYSFVVPGSLTTGTLAIGAGTFTGTEYDTYVAENGNGPITITAPATMAITFPAVPVSASQKRPPWIGAALPPTAAPSSRSQVGYATPGSGDPGFPIWAVVLILVGVAGLVVVLQRWVARRRAVSAPIVPTPAPIVIPRTISAQPADESVVTVPDADRTVPPPSPPAPTPPAPSPPAPTPSETTDPLLRIFGPVDYNSYLQPPDRRITEELLCWLLLHNEHTNNADEIQLGLRPTDGARAEVSRKTFHSYLSGLRQCIGADHLPDATAAGGYRVTGIECDWFVFQRLSDEADRTTGPQAIELRTRALALVRGIPFKGVPRGQYEWVFSEGLHTQMTNAVVTCGLRLSNDYMDLGRYQAAQDAAEAGLRGAPRDVHLERARDRAVEARNEGLFRPGRSIGDDTPVDPGEEDGTDEPELPDEPA